MEKVPFFRFYIVFVIFAESYKSNTKYSFPVMISLIILILTLFFMGKTFEKMGRKFWEGIIPLYNLYVLLVEIKKPLWWFILLFIPLVNIVVLFLIYNELAKRFSQNWVIALITLILPFVGFGLLAYMPEAVWRK